jgi:hypothetical protein
VWNVAAVRSSVDGWGSAEEAAVSASDEGEVLGSEVARARLVLREHRRVCVPEPACNGCLSIWPCADVVWAWSVLPDEA